MTIPPTIAPIGNLLLPASEPDAENDMDGCGADVSDTSDKSTGDVNTNQLWENKLYPDRECSWLELS